ncbi:GNAT family N-acetyltransferase [Streptomyces finlayi]|uniref:GNAT family N-acetyltransferase n=1 Tax=Streptomyces finlayi TaxID=67296 RepID=A0A7G7BHW3_9ACTN|nr:GNAT family N-acetyltransferase [Streptomyces finlayi]QNE74928.1 GNAT family N-acetyltransferase [Streptomyces finlayi]
MTAPAPGDRGAPGLVPLDPDAHTETVWRLARERDLAALGREETTRAWITGRLTAPGLDARRDARLLPGADGRPVGAVWLSSASGIAGWTVELVLGPDATADDGARLLEFAERRCGEQPAGGEGELSCFVSEGEQAARAALHSRGYGSPHPYYRMAVTLDDALPQPPDVPGAVVRHLDGERDFRTFHAVKNTAYAAEEAGKSEDGFDTWLEWWRTDPGVAPAQCALLEVDGTAVGFANITDRMLESRDAAYVRQIGVAPHARQRGLGSLLLLSVMHASRSRGRTAMVLTVDTANAPALALYQRLGWRVETRFDDFRRTVTR